MVPITAKGRDNDCLTDSSTAQACVSNCQREKRRLTALDWLDANRDDLAKNGFLLASKRGKNILSAPVTNQTHAQLTQ